MADPTHAIDLLRKKRPKLRATVVLSLAVLLSIEACEAMSALRELQDLGQLIEREFRTDDVSLNLTNSSHLEIILVGSPLADVPQKEQKQLARRVAEFVGDEYPGYSALETIRVTFTQASRFAFVRVARSTSYSFATADIQEVQELEDVDSLAEPGSGSAV